MILDEELPHKILKVNTGAVASTERVACQKTLFVLFITDVLLVLCDINSAEKSQFLLLSIYRPRRPVDRTKKTKQN